MSHVVPPAGDGADTSREWDGIVSRNVARAFRVIDTGIVNDPDASVMDQQRRRPIRLELRRSYYERDRSLTYPYTTVLLWSHLLHVATLLSARHIHLKYMDGSGVSGGTGGDTGGGSGGGGSSGGSSGGGGGGGGGDTYIMFRTEHMGLITYSTINNRHWIPYLLVHATGQEDYREAGEGEFRLEVVHERHGRMDFTVNVIYIEGGVKVTMSIISS